MFHSVHMTGVLTSIADWQSDHRTCVLTRHRNNTLTSLMDNKLISRILLV